MVHVNNDKRRKTFYYNIEFIIAWSMEWEEGCAHEDDLYWQAWLSQSATSYAHIVTLTKERMIRRYSGKDHTITVLHCDPAEKEIKARDPVGDHLEHGVRGRVCAWGWSVLTMMIWSDHQTTGFQAWLFPGHLHRCYTRSKREPCLLHMRIGGLLSWWKCLLLHLQCFCGRLPELKRCIPHESLFTDGS